jgi:hypothetical protein
MSNGSTPSARLWKLVQIFGGLFLLLTFGTCRTRTGNGPVHAAALSGPAYLVAVAVLVVLFILLTTTKLGGTPIFGSSNDTREETDRVDDRFVGADFTPLVQEQRLSARQELARLAGIDENFSLVLFEDFAGSLFSTAHEASAAGKLDALWPYVAPAARAMIQQIAGGRIGDVAVEAIRYESVQGAAQPGNTVRVALRFTSTCAANGAGGIENWRFVERWRFSREAKARSKPPELALALACPNCGAPLGDISAETCAHCNQVTGGGLFDWYVEDVSLIEEHRIDITAEANAQPEPATIISPRAESRCQALAIRDPQFGWDAFEKRVQLIVHELSAARAEQNWKRARPFISDGLFRAEMARMDARARTSDSSAPSPLQYVRLDLADVETDKFFDAIAVRVWCKGGRAGKSESSEYWTLLRGRGRSGAATTEKSCPSCGAALEISMAGTCKYCNSNITSGQFDWVLGRIEHPDAYAG